MGQNSCDIVSRFDGGVVFQVFIVLYFRYTVFQKLSPYLMSLMLILS